MCPAINCSSQYSSKAAMPQFTVSSTELLTQPNLYATGSCLIWNVRLVPLPSSTISIRIKEWRDTRQVTHT
jgi:hypothetical protein